MGGGAKLMRLSTRVQIIAGVGISLLLAGSFILTESLIPFGILIGAFAVFAIVRNPVASLLAFIVINVFLTLHGKDNGTPTVIDLSLGIILMLIMAYWLIRLRIFELESLSTSTGQLALALFAAWSVIVTIIGLFGDNTTLNFALREMLNLSPLLVLPIIYTRFVELESPAERKIMVSVLISGIIIIIWNFVRMRSNVLRAVYLYQTGRGNSDELVSGLIVLIATSILMTIRSFWKALPTILLLLLGLVGVVISFRRNLYLSILICIVGLLYSGTREERRHGIKYLVLTGFAGVSALLPFYFSSRIFRLLLVNYGMRFISSQHLGTDLSLRMRYVEWKSEWHDILQSPILGHGFGAKFRIFDIVRQVHYWMPFSHNGFLYMSFKTGFIGAFLFFGAYITFMIKGFQLLKLSTLSFRTRIMLRSGVGFLMVLFLNTYTEPVLDSKSDLIWVGIIIGYLLVIERYVRNQGVSLDTLSS